MSADEEYRESARRSFRRLVAEARALGLLERADLVLEISEIDDGEESWWRDREVDADAMERYRKEILRRAWAGL